MPASAPTDDRGNPVKLYGLLSDRPRLARDEAVPLGTQSVIEHRVRRPVRARRVAVYVCFGVLAYAVAGVFAQTLLTMGLAPYAVMLATVLACVVFAVVAVPLNRRARHRRHGPRIIAEFLAEAYCPACGYDLAGTAPGADGFTACPECGAAWNMPRGAPRSR